MNPLKNLKRRPARSALTIAGITMAITMLIIMLSIGAGMRESAASLVYDSGVDIFITGEGGNPFMGGAMVYNGTEMAREIKEENPDIRGVVASLEGISLFVSSGSLGRDNIAVAYFSGSLPDEDAQLRGFDIIEGSDVPHKNSDPFRNSTYYQSWNLTPEAFESPEFTGECTISDALAEELKIGPGDEILVGTGMDMNHTIRLKVYGIFTVAYESPDTREVYTHISELQYFLGLKGDPINAMYVDLYDPSKAGDVKEWIEEKYPLSAMSREEFIGQINRFMDTFQGFSMMISTITTLVGIIFISTIMNIAIRERRKEIAAMRAIGISQGTIVREIVLEGIAITLVGFVFGVLFGTLGAMALESAVSSTKNLPAGFQLTKITLSLLFEVFLLSVSIGILSSLAPARWSTKINISKALRGD